MKLIEDVILANECVVGFNLAFDWFQICKIYTLFNCYKGSLDDYPEDHIPELAELESEARFGPCLKPRSALDLMLTARKTKYQSTMNRGDIRIRKVPTVLANLITNHLEKEVVLSNILFAKRKDKYAPRWRVFDCVKKIGGRLVPDPDFRDIVLKFKPSVALKALAIDALNIPVDDLLLFGDINVDKHWLPNEIPWAPFADAVRRYPIKKGTNKLAKRLYDRRHLPWHGAWPDVISHHINHWEYHKQARVYASKDVEYTRSLYKYFDSPSFGDDDSILACMVGAVRWKGFSVDLEGLANLKKEAQAQLKQTPINANQVRAYLGEVLDNSEKDALINGTGKVILEELAKWKNKACPMCEAMGEVDKDCSVCKGTNVYSHPVADRAQEVLDARFAKKEIELFDKLLLAGRFHASTKVIGTLSSRMSGTDGLNAQGVKRTYNVRSKFTFSDDGKSILVGGDFDGFEVVLADAVYKDLALRAALMSGKKIHALFAMELFPDKSYEEICASKGKKFDMYDYGKRGVFSQIYGGNENTLVTKLGVTLEIAIRASKGFAKRYPGVGKAREIINDMFCTMKQEGGIGTKIIWNEPRDYIESLFGFRRYFVLENQICKSLFQLAVKPPATWKAIGSKIKVQRRDREQTVSGATASALYSAAFQLQAANMRAAANHVIQSSGAQITKHCQRRLWDLQPPGINPWMVQCLNIHDEILCVIDPNIEEQVSSTIASAVESYRNKVPLIRMDWKRMQNWGEK